MAFNIQLLVRKWADLCVSTSICLSTNCCYLFFIVTFAGERKQRIALTDVLTKCTVTQCLLRLSMMPAWLNACMHAYVFLYSQEMFGDLLAAAFVLFCWPCSWFYATNLWFSKILHGVNWGHWTYKPLRKCVYHVSLMCPFERIERIVCRFHFLHVFCSAIIYSIQLN